MFISIVGLPHWNHLVRDWNRAASVGRDIHRRRARTRASRRWPRPGRRRRPQPSVDRSVRTAKDPDTRTNWAIARPLRPVARGCRRGRPSRRCDGRLPTCAGSRSSPEFPGGLVCITQNIDGLLTASGCANMLDLHDNMDRTRCVSCARDLHSEQTECPNCHAHARPDVVMVGEALPRRLLADAEWAAKSAEVGLVIGTSGVVHPAAGLAQKARNRCAAGRDQSRTDCPGQRGGRGAPGSSRAQPCPVAGPGRGADCPLTACRATPAGPTTGANVRRSRAGSVPDEVATGLGRTVAKVCFRLA